MGTSLMPSTAAPTAAPVALPALIASIGEPQLGTHLIDLMHGICGAEHSAVFDLSADELTAVISASHDGTQAAYLQATLYVREQLWRRDPSVREAQSQLEHAATAFSRTDIPHLTDERLREIVFGRTNICDRVLICGRSKHGIVGLSALRSARTGAFSQGELQQLSALAGSLLAIISKHIEIRHERTELSAALASLSKIESCVAAVPENFPRRESQVCARTIYGMSSCGIALELGISEPTVITYRKRVYERLGIATQRELLLWYMSALRLSTARLTA